jgi:hypothetical protein
MDKKTKKRFVLITIHSLQHSYKKKKYHLFMSSDFRFKAQLTLCICVRLLNLEEKILHDQAARSRPEEDALVWRLEEKSSEFTLFDLSEILHTTHNFSQENLLGKGGFGPVYKVNVLSRKKIILKLL